MGCSFFTPSKHNAGVFREPRQVLTFVLLLIAFASPACGDDTRPYQLLPCGYGGGGRFTTIALDPEDANRVFIGSDVAGVFRSTDGGRSFSLKGKNLQGFAAADVLIHPRDARVVYLLTQDGFSVSEDFGETWTRKTNLIRYEPRFFGSRLMAFWNGLICVATDKMGVFMVRHGPAEWSVETTAPPPGVLIRCLAVVRGEVTIGTSQGVFRLHENRREWIPADQGLSRAERDIMDMAVSENGAWYLVEKKTGLWAWNPSATVWESRPLPPGSRSAGRASFKALAVHPAHPETVLMASHPDSWPHALFRSMDGGRSWTGVDRFALSPESPENWTMSLESVEEIAFSSSSPNEVYLTDWWNLWKSEDNGVSWRQIHQGLQNTVVNDVKVHPLHPQIIYASIADNGLMVTADGGKHWHRRMKGVVDGHAREVEISRQQPSKVFMIVNPWKRDGRYHVYQSTDGGESWTDIGFPVPADPLPSLGYVDGLITNIEIDHSDDKVIYVGTNGHGVFKTTDGGSSWRPVGLGLKTPYVKGPGALLMDPKNPRILFASTQQGGVYRTSDGGENWSSVSPGHTFTFGMAIDPTNSKRVLAGCAEKKVIVSDNGGLSWNEVALPGPPRSDVASYGIALLPFSPQTVIVGTLAYDFKAAEGLFVSSDGGRFFSRLDLDLPSVNVNCIAAGTSAHDGFLVGFNGIGLFRGR